MATIMLRQMEITYDARRHYNTQITRLLEQAAIAMEGEDDRRAEHLFQQVLRLQPDVLEAYNNLGVIYGRREDHAHAREMYQQALQVNPSYVYARCNLALYVMGDDLDAAEAMIKPLTENCCV